MNKKIGIVVGSLVVAGVVGFGVYQTSADSNVLFQPSESAETEELKITETEETVVASETEEASEQTEKTTAEAPQSGTDFSEQTRDEIRAQLTEKYPGIVTQFELDRDDGRFIYEVDIYGPEAEYELDVDAETGEIIKVEEERDKGKKYEVLSGANLISIGEAESIALNEFDGTIKEVNLDRDDGRIIYEIEMKNGEKEAEFDIDATTGEIIELEFDED